MKTPKTKEVITHFLKELETPAKDPNQWEMNFLISIQDQFDRTGSLSDRQFEILEKIYANCTA